MLHVNNSYHHLVEDREPRPHHCASPTAAVSCKYSHMKKKQEKGLGLAAAVVRCALLSRKTG